MRAPSETKLRDTPEQLIHGVVRKLTRHVLCDALLIFLPPLAVVLYVLFHLYLNGWLSPFLAALLGFAALAIGAVAILMSYRPNVPSAPTAARLIDDRAGAQDRFLTLATLQTFPGGAFLLARLRAEAAGLQSRIAVQREFPYKIKGPVYSSLIVSFCAALLFHLLLPIAHSSLRPQPAHERLRDLAQEMAARPNLQERAESLKNLAAKLEDPKLLPQERQDLAREERKKVSEQANKESEKQDRDLLSQAAGTLQDIEQQSGAGERTDEQQGAGGDIQSNLPQQRPGESKQSQGSGGDSKGETNAESKADMQNGKVARADPKEQGQEKAPGNTNGGKANQPDPDRSASKRDSDRPGTSDGPGADRDGRSKGTDEIPQTAPPADRFHKPGEGGYQGVKGAGYVTVQLPEEHAGTGTGGESRTSKSGKAASSQLPISNAPLPKHVPDAPSEKQQMPLEYRNIIR